MTSTADTNESRLARAITEVTAPAPTALALLLVVAWHGSTSKWAAVVWGAVAVVFASLLPLAYILRGVRTGRWSDRHVSERHQRHVPLAVGMVSVAVGLGLLLAGGAPRELLALVAAMFAGLGTALLVTLRWKMSIHTAVVSGSVVILALVFGPALLLLLPVVALVAWSRVELDDHTPLQTLAGAVQGAAVAYVVFTLLR